MTSQTRDEPAPSDALDFAYNQLTVFGWIWRTGSSLLSNARPTFGHTLLDNRYGNIDHVSRRWIRNQNSLVCRIQTGPPRAFGSDSGAGADADIE